MAGPGVDVLSLPALAEGTQPYGKLFGYTNVLASPTAVAGQTVAEQSITVTGLAATDVVIAVNKPSQQAGLGLLTGRVSAANVLKLSFAVPGTTSILPTAAEGYTLMIYRPQL